MKRKHETAELIKESRPEKQQQVSQNLNLKSVCVITQSCEVNSPFSLSSFDQYIVMRNKNDADVFKFEKHLGNHESKLQLSSTKYKCSQYDVSSTLKLNEKRILSTSTHQEINDIMLNPMLMAGCSAKNFQIIKCHLSPSHKNQEPLLASLSSFGSIEISKFHYDRYTSQTKFESLAELCETRKASFSLSSSYVKLNKLKEIIDELTFTNFDWCPIINETNFHIATITTTNELILYSINLDGNVSLQCSEKLEGTACELKWIVTPDGHFLFVANTKGQLVRYLIEMADEQKFSALMKVDEIEGILKIPVSNIYAEQVVSSTLLICTKAHSLEIFLIKKSSAKSLTKYVGLCITGMVSVSNLTTEFLVQTMNNKIFFMKLSIVKNEIKIDTFEKIETKFDIKYAAYGITASNNKSLVFVSSYPQAMYDHLVLKQPKLFSINVFSKNAPDVILMKNRSLQLTDFVDCMEAVRYIGILEIESLKKLESMSYKTELSRDFLYYLKLQLIVVKAKLVYYRIRSDTLHDRCKNSKIWLKITIEVINSFFLIKSMLARKKKLSDASAQSICCLATTIQNFLNDETAKGQFITIQKTLRNELENLLTTYKGLKNLKDQETCLYCEETIEASQLMCKQNHEVSRCVITKLQIPIEMSNVCTDCNCGFIDQESLQEITEKEEQLCPFCDRFIKFSCI